MSTREVAALACALILAACGGGDQTTSGQGAPPQESQSTNYVAPEGDSGGDQPSAGDSGGDQAPVEEAIPPVEPTEQEPTQEQPLQRIDADNPLLSLDENWSAEEDPTQLTQTAPPDGTITWGADDCVWIVAEGYWIPTWICRVPDANGDPNIFFFYPRGTDPITSWVHKVYTDPAVTANGGYYVFWPKGGTNWERCAGTCTIAETEVLNADGTWWTADQWNAAIAEQVAAAQAATQAAESTGMTVLIGGQGPGIIGSTITAQGGVPSDVLGGLTPEQWAAGVMGNLNIAMNNIWLAPECTSSYNGCG